LPKPQIGLSMLYLLSKPFNQMAKQLTTLDTKYVEIVDDGAHSLTANRVALLKQIAASRGFHYSVHAPFADINIASPNPAIRKTAMRCLKKSMNYARDLDAYLWVFHPGSKSGISSFYPGADWNQNRESIKEIHQLAKELGVKIAMENLPEKYMYLMKTPEDFQRFYTETGLEDIGIVLDTGHAHLEGQIAPLLEKLPKKIVHVHVSDNHGVVDEHFGLGYGTIDWQQFTAALKATGFSGTVLTESVHNVEETVQKLRLLFS